MSTPPHPLTVVVIGGTGTFGGAVARSLHANSSHTFHVRATTRDPSTPKAARLARLGISVVRADSWNASDLAAAFHDDTWAVFLNTDSDDADFKAQRGPPESAMGRTVIDAAVAAGVKHFVYAGLPEASRVTGGAVPILSFDEKAEIAAYARQQQQAGLFESAATVTSGWALEIFWMRTYAEAFGGFAMVRDEEGFLTLHVPPMGNAPESVPWTAVEDDYGDAVHGVLLDPRRWDGRTVWAVSECRSFEEVTEAYNRVAGTREARYVVKEGALEAGTEGKTKEVNGLFDYCHYVKGEYCGGKPLDQEPMKLLKRMASVARGCEKSDLQTAEGFMAKKISK
ncbi:NmrA-like family domain-containing protein 1 [Lasiodiplodia theobromae]|uniref:NmrA-like family domain-containing protein 1 n=1 Tax=Lasiodiplodia theobromae TaxID=45133 RepID=A0A5N5D8M5_9PEZI|nr:NmrA-like family domain-containing protein 1 [Lasiodiplodia theobromae]